MITTWWKSQLKLEKKTAKHGNPSNNNEMST